jgi:endonuclease YncB( thermonuclease family)
MAKRARFRRGRPSWRRAFELLGAFAVLAAVAVAAAILDERSMQTLAGAPRAVDGDTLAFGERRVRLVGIDAPELGQTCERDGADYDCGREARRFLAGLVEKGQCECSGNEEDRYGRLLVRCVSATTDLNAAMVRAGWAVSYGGYEAEERIARDDHSGLWAGTFDRPAAWRARHGAVADLGPADMARRLINRIARMFGKPTGKEEE